MQYTGQYEPIQYYNQENISITLHNQDLWSQFHHITNEMIVTKSGRRMFPIISVNIHGLDPDKMYTVELTFDQLENHRWRYVSREWQPGMKPDPVIYRAPYQHPDSPNYGRTWMKEPVSFPKVKLTNKIDQTGPAQVILNSLHKYRPRISIIDVILKKKIYETSFDETEFIAVTAYQNEEVKALKIRYNPFAKAFLYGENSKEEPEDEEQQPGNRVSIHGSQDSSSGGPNRIKRQSYRSSPYTYAHSQRKSSPINGFPHTSSSTSQLDLAPLYGPIPSTNVPCASSSSSPPLPDCNIFDPNMYYSSSSPYYFPYGAPQPSSSASYYPFISPFNYPLNNSSYQETTSFIQMQPPMASTDYNNYMNFLSPITDEMKPY